MSEPCTECGCPGEQYDGHVCEDFIAPAGRLRLGPWIMLALVCWAVATTYVLIEVPNDGNGRGMATRAIVGFLPLEVPVAIVFAIYGWRILVDIWNFRF